MKKIHIAWAGGGTGGHVFPIKSLIQHLQTKPTLLEKTGKLYWFGTKKSLEEENCKTLQSTIKNLYFLPIFSGKWRRDKSRKSLLLNIKDLFLFIVGILQSLFYILIYRIDVVFCKGGYVALPVVAAAKLLGKKIVVHESDVHPGLVNRLSSKVAKKIFTGFDNVLPHSTTVGQILSEDLLPKDEYKESDKTKVLVMGGSQGSKDLYEALAKVLELTPELTTMEFEITLGKLNKELNTIFSAFSNVTCYDFLSQKEIGEKYLNCDIAITRAGTTSLAEQELFDLKLIMVPIPWTHDQLDNAKWYVNQKDGILIQQDDPEFIEKLQTTLVSLNGYKKSLQQRDRKQEISEAKDKILHALFYDNLF